MTITRLRAELLTLMKSEPKELYSVYDVLEHYKGHQQLKGKTDDKKYKAIDNMFRQMWVSGIICRHIDKDEHRNVQYAASISDNKKHVWVKNETIGQGNSHNNKGVKRRKGQLLSSKEIRSMFAAHYNNMAKLEDACMAVIENSEMTEREMAKIRNFLGKGK